MGTRIGCFSSMILSCHDSVRFYFVEPAGRGEGIGKAYCGCIKMRPPSVTADCILGWIAGGAGGSLRNPDDNFIITPNLSALTAVGGDA
jgi:hypothetical protein